MIGRGIRIILSAIMVIFLNSSNSLIFAEKPLLNRIYLNSPEIMRKAQMALRDKGYYNGPINGQLSPATQKALENFQSKEDIDESYELDRLTAERLGIVPEVHSPAISGSASVSSRESLMLAQQQLREEGYYDGPIDGLYTESTRRAIEKFQDKNDLVETGRLDLPTSDALGLNVYTVNHEAMRVVNYNLDSKELIAYAQKELMEQKYYDGPINGVMSAMTEKSIRAFQKDHDIPVTGFLDRDTAKVMLLKPVKVSYQEIYKK
jgi:peptidoglycan hydrolase-like protein with peptidoglycan-binding domain